MIQQTQFDVETGLPRWGCLWMDLVVAAYLAAMGREPRKDEVLRIYNDCRQQFTTRWVEGIEAGTAPVLEMLDTTTRAIVVNDPTGVLGIALSYTDNGWRGKQYPDLDT